MTKEIDRIPVQNSPDVNQAKAIGVSAIGVIVAGGFSALSIAVITFLLSFVCILIYGVGIALSAL